VRLLLENNADIAARDEACVCVRAAVGRW